jgi:hypothetical protein
VPNSPILTIRVHTELKRAILAHCERTGETVSEFVATLLADTLDCHPPPLRVGHPDFGSCAAKGVRARQRKREIGDEKWKREQEQKINYATWKKRKRQEARDEILENLIHRSARTLRRLKNAIKANPDRVDPVAELLGDGQSADDGTGPGT